MKRSRFNKEQIIVIVKEQEAGMRASRLQSRTSFKEASG
jgi:hypothetical protein